MSSGIYLITNLINNKVYIGSSVRIQRRWIEHRFDLKHQKHQNRHLQRAWNKYGKENFAFEIIELCDKSELSSRESYWADLFNAHNRDKGYNIRGVGENQFVADETKKKISAANTGKKRTDEQKACLSKINRERYASGWRPSAESVKRQADKRRGQKHTEETKAYISKVLRGKNKNRRAVTMMDMDGNYLQEFGSMADAARFLGIMNKAFSYSSLNLATQGKRKQAYGYKCKYSE